MKISRQIMLSILLPLLVVSAVITYFTSQALTQHVESQAKISLQQLTQSYTTSVNLDLNHLSRTANWEKNRIESTLNLHRFNTDEAYRTAYLKDFNRDLAALASANGLPAGYFIVLNAVPPRVTTMSGLQDYDSNGSYEKVHALSNTYYMDAENDPLKDWYTKPLQTGKSFWLGPTKKKHALQGSDYLSISYPITINGTRIGVAVAELDNLYMKTLLQSFHFHTNGYVALMDPAYRIIAHPLYDSGSYLTEVEQKRYLSMAKTFETYNAGTLEFSPPSDSSQVLSYSRTENDWILFLVTEKAEILDATGQLNWVTIGLIAISLLLSLGISYGLGLYTSRPIRTLSSELAHADLLESHTAISPHLIRRHDEIGILTNAITQMKQSQSELAHRIEDYNVNLSAKVNTRNQDLITLNEELSGMREDLMAQQEELRSKNQILEHSISDMMAMQKQLIDSEKIASFGFMIAGIADEIDIPMIASLKLSEELQVTLNQVDLPTLAPDQSLAAVRRLLEKNVDLMKYLYFSKDIVDYIKDIVHSRSNQKRLPIMVREVLINTGNTAIGLVGEDNIQFVVKCPETLVIFSDPALFGHILFSIYKAILSRTKMDSQHFITVKVVEEGADLKIILYDNAKLNSDYEDHLVPKPDNTASEDFKQITIGFNMINILMKEFFKGDFNIYSETQGQGNKYVLLFKNYL